MKTTNATRSRLENVGGMIGNFAKAVVSGLPRNKVYIKTETKQTFHPQNRLLRSAYEKHYHRATGKPVVERQTLLKESKKARVTH